MRSQQNIYHQRRRIRMPHCHTVHTLFLPVRPLLLLLFNQGRLARHDTFPLVKVHVVKIGPRLRQHGEVIGEPEQFHVALGLFAIKGLDLEARSLVERKVASQIVQVDSIGRRPTIRKFGPNNLQRFDVVLDGLAVAFGTFNGKHARLVEDKTKLVSRVGEHAKFGQFGFEPPPRGLTPDHEIVVLVALGQKVIHVGPFHARRTALSDGVRRSIALQGFATKVEERVIEIQYHQGFAVPGWVHKMDGRVFRKLFERFARGDVIEPLVRAGIEIQIKIVNDLCK